MKRKAIKVLRYAIANKGIDKKTMQRMCGKDYEAVCAYLYKLNIGKWRETGGIIYTNDNAELAIRQIRNEIRSYWLKITSVTAAAVSAIVACIALLPLGTRQRDTPATQQTLVDDVRKDSTRTLQHGDSPSVSYPQKGSPCVPGVKYKEQLLKTNDSVARCQP